MAHVETNRLPGVHAERKASYRRIIHGGDPALWPGGVIVDGAESRDPTNDEYPDVLQAGTLLGRITSGGQFAPAVIGLVTENYSDTDTELTTTPAAAAELVRRIGASGTFQLVNAPTATGVKSVDQVTYSAVNTTTGVITVTDIGQDVVAGSLIQPEDGSETILGLLGKGDGLKVTDSDNKDVSVQLAEFIVGGHVIAENIINWPAAATIQTHIKDELRASGKGYTFTDEIQG